MRINKSWLSLSLPLLVLIAANQEHLTRPVFSHNIETADKWHDYKIKHINIMTYTMSFYVCTYTAYSFTYQFFAHFHKKGANNDCLLGPMHSYVSHLNLMIRKKSPWSLNSLEVFGETGKPCCVNANLHWVKKTV